MPRSETILSIFVASPSDVSEERDRVDYIVRELNATHARRTGIRLEALRWERDVSAAAIKEDAQAEINDQIPQDYDVFLGIFWHRLGTSTMRSESGTVEEYEIAWEKFKNDPDSVRLMLYFKDAPPLSMDEFDADQFKKVMEFRKKVEKEVIYKKFVDADSFANIVRADITKLILDKASSSGSTLDGSDPQCGGDKEEAREVEDDEEEGYLDLMESFEEEMDSLYSTLTRVNDAIVAMGEQVHQRAEELTSLASSVEGKNLSKNERQRYRSDALQVMKRTSKDMAVFTKRMKQDIPLFRRHLDKGISVFANAVPIYLELHDGEDKEGIADVIISNLKAMADMLESMEGLRDTVDDLPRMATSLNRARRETKKVLQQVVDATKGGITSLEAVFALLR